MTASDSDDDIDAHEADAVGMGAGDVDGNALEGFAENFDRQGRPACQLYLISPPAIDAGFSDQLKSAFSGGSIAAFQLRLKGVAEDAVLRAAETLLPICRAHDVSFIINDSADLARRAGADGVHLGQGDGDPRAARLLLGPEAQIGVTCHDSRHLAMEAGEAGADYVAFGAFHPTTTKAVKYRPSPSILSWWTTLFEVPCVAIGGINARNARPLVEAGADFIAVSSAIWGAAAGPEAAVRELSGVLAGGQD